MPINIFINSTSLYSLLQSVTDMSPYVRKTAAHAIPKLYTLDPEQKEQLTEIIEKLLKDQTTVSTYIHIYMYIATVHVPPLC